MNKRNILHTTAAMLVVTVLCAGAVWAETYHVSTKGDNANDGLTEEKAFKTIAHAAKVAKAGDTVMIQPGNYGCERVVFANSGTEKQPIKFKGVWKRAVMPVLKGDDTGVGIAINGKSYIEVSRLVVEHYRDAFVVAGWSHHITLEDNIAYENAGKGKLAGKGRGFCIGRSHHCTIRRNVGFDNDLYNFMVCGHHQKIERNIAYNTWRTIPGFGSRADYGFRIDKCTESVFLNNVAFGNGWHGFRLRYGTSNNLFKGNKAFNNGGYEFEINDNCDNNKFVDCVADGRNEDYPLHPQRGGPMGLGGSVGFVVYDGSSGNSFENCLARNGSRGFDVRSAFYSKNSGKGYDLNVKCVKTRFVGCAVENCDVGFRMLSPESTMERCRTKGVKTSYDLDRALDTAIINPLDKVFKVRIGHADSRVKITFADKTTKTLGGKVETVTVKAPKGNPE
ncbi:MAG: right-handed parallel beta-helix repeat-containing protein [Phycisphaerae bacterium]|nr:right-handed parallel beta-helix repeat-containing protein [Phycisphaerae bacterium]